MVERKLVNVKIILDKIIKNEQYYYILKQCYLVKHLIHCLVLHKDNCMAVSNHVS